MSPLIQQAPEAVRLGSSVGTLMKRLGQPDEVVKANEALGMKLDAVG